MYARRMLKTFPGLQYKDFDFLIISCDKGLRGPRFTAELVQSGTWFTNFGAHYVDW